VNYLILTLSRSGHHAFINWMLPQFKKGVIHYNNCQKGWENKKFIPDRAVTTFGEKPFQNKIYGIERFDIDDFFSYRMEEWGIDQTILFMRDGYNNIASLYKLGTQHEQKHYMAYLFDSFVEDNGIKKSNLFKLWKKQAKNIEVFLRNEPKYLFINYNEWFVSEKYRRLVASKMKIERFSDENLNFVPGFGGGSSFTKHDYQNRAQKMQTLERYKNFLNNEKYLSLINDEEFKRLNKKYFNFEININKKEK
jgi:hypothetical protein